MHEYSIVQNLISRVEEEARRHDAATVHRVRVRIGELSGVENDLLLSAWRIAREHSTCASAELTIIPVPIEWICSGCHQEIPVGEVLRCPDCQLPARLACGDEIHLDEIDLEVS